MTLIDYIRLFAAIPALTLALMTTMVNWGVFVALVTRSVPKGKAISAFPFFGGTLGVLGFILLPFSWFHVFWWLPLAVDIGTGPFAVLAAAGWCISRVADAPCEA